MSHHDHIAAEAEVSVLGSMLLDNRCIPAVADVVSPGDFADPDRRAVYQAALALNDAGHEVDVVTLCERMAPAYGSRVTDVVMPYASASATAANVEHHARMVRGAADLRAMSSLLADAMREAQDSAWDEAADVRERLVDRLLNTRAEGRTEFIGIGASAKRLLKQTEERYHAAQRGEAVAPVAWTTGLPPVDDILGGFRPGALYALGAASGVGKTAFALHMAEACAHESGTMAVYVSCEVPGDDLTLRQLATHSRANASAIESGLLTMEQVNGLMAAVRRLSSDHVQLVYRPKPSIALVRQSVRRAKRMGRPLGLVVVDYLQRFAPIERSRHSREREVADMVGECLAVAQDFNVPVLALSQLNRKYDEARTLPRVDHFRESSVLEHDSHAMLGLHDPHRFDEGEPATKRQVVVLKNRKGSTGVATLHADMATGRFGAWTNQQGGW